MPEEKRSVGRPRKYTSKAERQKAYYERKKKKMKELEEEKFSLEAQKKLLQEKLNKSLKDLDLKDITNFDWNKFTPIELTLLSAGDLKLYISTLQEKLENIFSFGDLIENLVNIVNIKSSFKNDDMSQEKRYNDLIEEFGQNISDFQEGIQLQTLLFLLEAELASRERMLDRDAKLSVLKAEIKELETMKLEEKPKIKSKK
ncbi:MAG: hypothetical protein FK731_00345 [Asgard group archaeon]|nr:hypothetical protein [Asgard group archaeon]